MRTPKIDHIGILVDRFDNITNILGEWLGVEIARPEIERALGLEILWLDIGDVALEIIRPVVPNTKAAKLLRDGVRGVHHIAFEVDDVDEKVCRLRTEGIPMLDKQPRPGVHGSRIAFIDPNAVSGTLIELVTKYSASRNTRGLTDD